MKNTNKLKEEFENMKAEVELKSAQDQDKLKRDIQDEISQKDTTINDLATKLKDKESEMQKTIDKLNEEAKSKDAIIENFDVQGPRLALLTYIYSKTMGSKVDFTHDSELKLCLSNDKDKNFVKEYVNLKIKLPNLKRLRLHYIDSKAEGIKEFMRDCHPDTIKFLDFNENYTENLNMDNYTDSMLGLLASVTQEVYLYRSNIKSSPIINKIVKACSQCPRLMITNSEIFADEECDFNTGLAHSSFKISFIQFSNWDSSVTGWTKHPERFENVVKGIKNCSLKDSLKTVVVWKNNDNCIGSTKAKEILDKHGLTSDKVKIEENRYGRDTS